MMEWAQLIVTLISALAWPSVVLVIAILFTDDLRKKIPGITKAGPTGFEQGDVQRTITAEKWSGELKEIPGLVRTPTMEAIEKSIHKSLQLIKQDTHVDLLVRHLAQSRMEGLFERAYGAMYGSQIAGLRALLAAGGAVPVAQAIVFFEQAKSKIGFPPDTTFGGWLNYLQMFGLATLEGDVVKITELGRDFLMFLSGKGLPEERPHQLLRAGALRQIEESKGMTWRAPSRVLNET